MHTISVSFLRTLVAGKHSRVEISRMRFLLCSIRAACTVVSRKHVHSHTGAYSTFIQTRDFRLTSRLSGFELWGTAKKHRKIKLHFQPDMTDPKIEEVLAPLRASVKEQVFAIWLHFPQLALNLTQQSTDKACSFV